MTMGVPEPLHDLARGDVGASRQLSIALRTIMNGTADQNLKDQIREILAGRSSARGLLRSDAFSVVLDQTMPSAIRQFAEMSEEERLRLAAQGQAQRDGLRDQAVEQSAATPPPKQSAAEKVAPTADITHPGTRKPNRDRIVTPDEPDEDDEYFRDRRVKGWLT